MINLETHERFNLNKLKCFMKQKENLTLVYQALLCQQTFGNLHKGFLVLAAKLPRDWVCSNIRCSELPLQLQLCNFTGSPVTFTLD